MWDITYFLFDPTKLSSNWNFVNLTPQNQETGKKKCSQAFINILRTQPFVTYVTNFEFKSFIK